MRNLKKFLALVLAMMMVLSLMVTVNAATTEDFSDRDEVKAEYKEALDLLVALRVIGGTDKGLEPNKPFTRAELAVMLYLVNNNDPDRSDSLLARSAGLNIFSDVGSDCWAEIYINYGAEWGGYLSGIGGGLYNPNGTVTLAEVFAAMMSALNLEAGSWSNVLSAAHKYGLDAGINTADFSGAATRQAAAQAFFNAMKWTPNEGSVRYRVTKTGKEDVLFPTVLEAWLYVNANGTTGYEVIPEEDLTGSLLQDLHKVTKSSGSSDAFGRPTTEYRKGGAVLYSLADEPVARFDTIVTEANLFAAVGASGIQGQYGKYIVMDEIWENGALVNQSKKNPGGWWESDSSLTGGLADSVVILNTDKTKTASTGNGTVVEIYETDTPNHYIMVCVKEYLGTVGTVTPANTNAGTKRNITITEFTTTNTGDTLASPWKYDSEEYEVGDKVLYQYSMKTGKITSVTTPEIIKGTLTRISDQLAWTNAGGNVYETVYTIGGAKYVLSDYAWGNGRFTPPAVGQTALAYLDSCGNIIGNATEAAAAAVNNFIYVLGNSTGVVNEYLTSKNMTYKVYGVLADGTYREFDVRSTENSVAANIKGTGNAPKLWKYTENDDGTITLGSTVYDDTLNNSAIAAKQTSVDGIVLNDETVFVFVKSVSNTDYHVGTVTVKTGNANIGAGVAANTAYVGAVNGVAKVVFVKGTYGDAASVADSGNVVYITSSTHRTETTTSASLWIYEGINGKGETVSVTTPANTALTQYSIYKYNTDGSVGDEVDTTDSNSTGLTKGSGVVMKIAGSTVVIQDSGTDTSYNASGVTAYPVKTATETALKVGQTVDFLYDTASTATTHTITAMWITANSAGTHKLTEVTLTGAASGASGKDFSDGVDTSGDDDGYVITYDTSINDTVLVAGATVVNKVTVTITVTAKGTAVTGFNAVKKIKVVDTNSASSTTNVGTVAIVSPAGGETTVTVAEGQESVSVTVEVTLTNVSGDVTLELTVSDETA